ncbi:tetratricopeptide repeat protein [Erythrobacter sp. sf7]|uniref:Tetratricopeptide repeat protein n=1 Tax=Erythrobacter fulvus TaxID=2987523 RepID=A0ABT5JPV9_9SPHN|nr:tetratricopeptide repeat protein [Erythrobacter fulvus]MDC8753612.1 tetratricopeptide repeat protein [Erythrobacter fulvus]
MSGLAMACSLLFAGCSDKVSEAAEYAAIAQVQLEAGNLDEARQNVQQAIIARDDVADYFVLLGRIELQSGKLPSAFNAYSRALDLQADNLEILQAIAELGLQTDRLSEAEEAADRMLLLFPGASRAMLVKGFLAIEAGRLEEAERFSDEILELNPNDEGGAILAARLLALKGQFEDAVAAVLETREAIGETEALNATLLEIYRAQGNAKGMREAFPKVIAQTGEDSNYQIDFVNFLYKTGNIRAARAEAAKAIAAQPNDRTRLALLNRLFLEYDRAPISPAQLSTMAVSATLATRLALARFYFDSAQYKEARSLLAQPLAEGVVEAQAHAARIALSEGRVQESDRLINAVLARDPRNPDALVARAERRLASGKIDGAIEDANIVVSDAPQEYAGYAALANAHLAKGSEVRARQVFERGVDFLSQSGILAARYEAFLRKVGDSARIVSLYGDLAMAKPSSEKAWQEFARVCEEFGNRVCKAKIERGLAAAKQSFVIDDPPGTPRARGLFARITPEQICRSSGGVCTGT